MRVSLIRMDGSQIARKLLYKRTAVHRSCSRVQLMSAYGEERAGGFGMGIGCGEERAGDSECGSRHLSCPPWGPPPRAATPQGFDTSV